MSIERPMKLVVFGANGATGQWLVRLAVERGHQVTPLMREGASTSVPQGVDVVCGDLANQQLGAAYDVDKQDVSDLESERINLSLLHFLKKAADNRS